MDGNNRQDFYNQSWVEAAQIDELPDQEHLEIILDMVKHWYPQERQRRLKIIDVGCGAGWISRPLLSFGEVVGVDSSETAIEIARSKCPEAKFYCMDILDEEVRRLKTFDLAIASEVIEHIPRENQVVFARQLNLLVRPGGILVFTMPNRLAWKYYWRNPASQQWKQPIEDWLTFKELDSLFSESFKCLQRFTFLLDLHFLMKAFIGS